MSNPRIAEGVEAVGDGNKLDARLLRIAFVVVLGSLMTVLDTTVVNVAIAGLSREFSAPLATIQWVSTGYILSLAVVIPLTGWASERFGTKRLYITSISLFVVGSLLSGLAWSPLSLIGFRVVQGLGGGMILPVGMTILTQAAGPKRMGRVMAIIGIPTLLGPVFGPMLGGYLVDFVSWRWIFFLNLPVGLIAVIASLRILEADGSLARAPLDWRGLVLLPPGLALLVFGLAIFGSSGGLGAPIICISLGFLLLAAFVVHAWRHDTPLIDVRLFTRPILAASAATTSLFGAIFFGLAFLLPLYLQAVRDQSAFDTGLLMAAQGLGAMLAMPIAGRLTDKIGPGKIVLTGLALVLAATFSLTRLADQTPFWWIEVILVVLGIGNGATLIPAMSGTLAALRRDEIARATSAINVLLRVGGSLGTAIFAVVLGHQLSELAPGKSLFDAVRAVPVANVAEAFGDAFYWSIGIAVAAVVAASFLPRKPADPGEKSAAPAPLV